MGTHATQTELHDILSSLQDGNLFGVAKRLQQLYANDEGDAAAVFLGQAHGSAVDLTAPLVAIPPGERLSWARYYLPALAKVSELSVEQARRLFQFAPHIERSYRGALNAAAVAYAHRQPESMPAVLEQLDASKAAAPVVELWAHGFGQGAPQQAAEFLVRTVRSHAADTALICTLLAALPEQDSDVHVHLGSACQELLLAVQSQAASNSESLGAPWIALVTLAGYCEQAWEALQDAIRAGTEYAGWAACFRLEVTNNDRPGFTSMNVRTLIELLTPAAFASPEIARRLDSAASSMLLRKEVADTVHEWADGLSMHSVAVADVFSSTFDGLVESSKRGPVLLTSWLLRQQVSVKSLHSLIDRFEATSAMATLDPDIYLAASPAMRAALPMRLQGLHSTGSFILSIARQLAEDDRLQGTGVQAAEALIAMAALDFPQLTRDLLEARGKELQPNSTAARMYKPALASIVRRHRELQRLPNRAELRPSVDSWQAYRAVRHRFNDSVLRKASEGSVFAVASVNLNVAQGRRFVIRHPQGGVQMGEMQEFTERLEQPELVNVDPVGFVIRRRNAVRGGRFG